VERGAIHRAHYPHTYVADSKNGGAPPGDGRSGVASAAHQRADSCVTDIHDPLAFTQIKRGAVRLLSPDWGHVFRKVPRLRTGSQRSTRYWLVSRGQ